jgi:hypothetical protein
MVTAPTLPNDMKGIEMRIKALPSLGVSLGLLLQAHGQDVGYLRSTRPFLLIM